jgi:putative heme-binding domain-containing protein
MNPPRTYCWSHAVHLGHSIAATYRSVALLVSLLLSSGASHAADDAADAAATAPTRVPWTTSRVIGTPEPPAPYTFKRAFPNLQFKQPVHMATGPGGRMFVTERNGRVVSFMDDQSSTETATFIEPGLGSEVYSLRFHPNYEKNRFVFVFTSVPNPAGATTWPRRANRIVRLTVDTNDPPRVIPESERTIIQYVSDGHNGGDLHFGPEDGYLYITSGDGTSDSDTANTGQDITDLPSGMIRIAVADSVEDDGDEVAYTVPDDNPFLEIEGARPELWAYGFRNPWRFCFDPENGDLYVGDVGQDLWEMIWLVQRGGNYGWSVREGDHDFHPLRKRGPTPILPPLSEHHHTESRSITGGVVYHGDRLPDLEGAYIYGDYETGKIWGLRHKGGKLTWRSELTDSSYRPASFELGPDGRFYLVGHLTGEIQELVPAEVTEQVAPFPRKLSETGLFRSVSEQLPVAGVLPYSVHAAQWSDGARAERWLAVPGDAPMRLTLWSQWKRDTAPWPFPEGTVLVKTLSGAVDSPQGKRRRRIETQLLTLSLGQWVGYSYRWNAEQTDAELLPKEGAPGDAGTPPGWRFVSRTECMVCHSRAAGFVLGATTVQLNHTLGDGTQQLERLVDQGLLEPLPAAPSDLKNLADPYDETAPIAERARSYLHANCAVCHVTAGGGNAKMVLSWHTELSDMALLGATPLHGDLGIPGAMLVSPGDPERSVLYHRLSRRGAGQMPPLGTAQVDSRAISVLERWIRGIKPNVKVREALDRNVAEAQGSSGVLSRWYLATAQSLAEEQLIQAAAPGEEDRAAKWYLLTAHGTPPRVGPHYPVDVPEDSTFFARTQVHPREPIDIELRAESSAPLTLWLDEEELTPLSTTTVVSSGRSHLTWEASLPAASTRLLVRLAGSEHIPQFALGFRRRSPNPKHEALTRAALSRTGDPADGRRIFFSAEKGQCSKCHKIEGEGASLAPDLTGAGSRFSRAVLIESILEPSRVISPRYTMHSVILDDGRVLSGIKVSETDDALSLGDPQGQLQTISKSQILQSSVEPLSIMPGGLEAALSENEFVGLIEFLMTAH